jgi:hypothetical protein
MTTWVDEYLQLVTDCENRESRLDDWQRQFIDSLRHQLEAGKRPTPKQIEKLDEVWEHATTKG